MRARRSFADAAAVLLFLGLTVALISFSFANAAALNLASGGMTIKNRTYDSPLTCTLTAVADTDVHAGQPNSSFGSQTTIEVNSSSSNPRRSLVRFDLSGCSPAIASDAIVHSATVRLTTASSIGLLGRSYGLHRATSSWTETTTWNTQPSVVAAATSTVSIAGLTGSGEIVNWPASRDVQALVAADESNLGWRVNDTNENGGILPLPVNITFSSREAGSNRPQLVITYAP